LGSWVKTALVVAVVIAVITRVAPVRKFVFNEPGV
jgi:hypothetical protein